MQVSAFSLATSLSDSYGFHRGIVLCMSCCLPLPIFAVLYFANQLLTFILILARAYLTGSIDVIWIDHMLIFLWHSKVDIFILLLSSWKGKAIFRVNVWHMLWTSNSCKIPKGNFPSLPLDLIRFDDRDVAVTPPNESLRHTLVMWCIVL